MKILMVFPSSQGGYGINEATEEPPLNIAYLASAAEKDGHRTEVLDANLLNYGPDKTADVIRRKKPDLLCLSLYAFNFRTGLEIAERTKKLLPGIITIAGGAHPSALMEKTLDKTDAIDAVAVGEGEMTLLEVAKRLDKGLEPFRDVDGVIYKNGSDIVRNKPREPITDLDTLAFPAYHLLPDISSYRRRALKTPAAPILTSRGCPFNCIFCSRSVFGNRVRYRSAENVMSEINYLVERFGVRQLDVVDDNFITHKERAFSILEALCRRPYRLAINLQSGVSAPLVDEKMLKLMKKAGVYRIAFGVESGNGEILKAIKKKQKLDDVTKAIRLAKKARIRSDTFFMVGLPGETPRSMRDTIDFAKKLDPHTANFHMAVPFPGTELYDMVKKEGKLLKDTEDGIVSGYNYPDAFYEMGELKKEDVERYYKEAYRKFYFRPGKIIRTIFNIRSFAEFVWLFKTGMLVIGSLFKKKSKGRAVKNE